MSSWDADSKGTYPGWAVRRAAPGQQQLDDVQVVVMNGHMQGRQAILQGEGQSHTQGRSNRPALAPSSTKPGRGGAVTSCTAQICCTVRLDLKSLKTTASWDRGHLLIPGGSPPQSWGGHLLTPGGHRVFLKGGRLCQKDQSSPRLLSLDGCPFKRWTWQAGSGRDATTCMKRILSPGL